MSVHRCSSNEMAFFVFLFPRRALSRATRRLDVARARRPCAVVFLSARAPARVPRLCVLRVLHRMRVCVYARSRLLRVSTSRSGPFIVRPSFNARASVRGCTRRRPCDNKFKNQHPLPPPPKKKQTPITWCVTPCPVCCVCQCVSSRCIAVTVANNTKYRGPVNRMKLTEYSSSSGTSSRTGSVGDGARPIAYTIPVTTAAAAVAAGGNGLNIGLNNGLNNGSSTTGRAAGAERRRKTAGKKPPRYDPFQNRDKSKATTCV